MRVLVTGVYGFIGSHFVKMLLDETDWHIVGLDRATSSLNRHRLAPNPGGRLSLVRGDIADASALSGICEDIDYVIHFAAKTFVDHSILDPHPFVQSNVIGTYNLLEQARRYSVKRFIQVSTDEVYGAILSGAYTEDSRLRPSNPYAATKAAGDMLALSYFTTFGLPTIVTRTENNYGPYQHRQKVLPAFVRSALSGVPLPVYGDGQHKRMWLHVEDHCKAIFQLLDKGRPGEVYHVAGEQELTNIELARIVLSTLDKPESLIRFVPDEKIRPGHDRRYALSTEKIRKELGWKPEVPLISGLQQTIRWYAENPWWTN